MRWNDRVVENEAVDVVIIPDFVPTREMIELYAGSARVPLAGTYVPDVIHPGSCPNDELQYDLTALPAGEYTLIHRASSAPPGYHTNATGWTTFEGEPALVTTLVHFAFTEDDAGLQDAGPADGGP